MSDSKKVIKGEEILLEIKPGTSILETNKKLAKKNKVILEKHNVRAIDIMGSIGAGKTSLIEKILDSSFLFDTIPKLSLLDGYWLQLNPLS